MKRTILAGASIFGASLFTITPASAAEQKPWSVAVTAGAEYDSNVSVQQTDVTTGVGDSAADLGLSAGYRLLDKTDGPQLETGYDFSQSLHAKLKEFDLQTHGLSLGGSAPVAKAGVGAGYSFYHVLLGGQSFLDMHMLNPSVSGFVVPNVYGRVFYFYFNKRFAAPNANRDADTNQVGGNLYRFFMQSKAFVSLGARYETEATVDPQLSYGSYALGANLQLPVFFGGRRGKVNVGYEYGRWNYDHVTLSIGAKRWENRSTARALTEIPLSRAVSLTGEYRFTDRHSNFPGSSYTQNQFLAGLRYTF
jgi:hypothetical protein